MTSIARTGLPIISLYTNADDRHRPTVWCDSSMRSCSILQDIGTRTWTYVGAMIYSMRAAARTGKHDHRARPPEPDHRILRRRTDARQRARKSTTIRRLNGRATRTRCTRCRCGTA